MSENLATNMDKLLKQLKELKQKKAVKERKLLRIKSCSSKQLHSSQNVISKSSTNCAKDLYENASVSNQCFSDSKENTRIVDFADCLKANIATSQLNEEIGCAFHEKLKGNSHFTSRASSISCAGGSDTSVVKVVQQEQNNINTTLNDVFGKNKTPSSEISANLELSLSFSKVEAFNLPSVDLLASQKKKYSVSKFLLSETVSANNILNLNDAMKSGENGTFQCSFDGFMNLNDATTHDKNDTIQCETVSASSILDFEDATKSDKKDTFQCDQSLTHQCESQLDNRMREKVFSVPQNFRNVDKLLSNTQDDGHASSLKDEAQTNLNSSSGIQISCCFTPDPMCDKENLADVQVSELLLESIVKVSKEIDKNNKTLTASSACSVPMKNCDAVSDPSCERKLLDEFEEPGNVFSNEASPLNSMSLKNPCKHQDQGLNNRDVENFDLVCTLPGARNERLLDSEVVLFNGVKFAVLLHAKEILVWRQEEASWLKIYCHFAEEGTSFEKMCILRSEDHLVIVMLSQRCCLSFLLFKKDENLLKVMENTHNLDESCCGGSVLLCGLDGLIFATSQSNRISLHTLSGLRETPHLISVFLGCTDPVLHSLCRIANIPNALMAVSASRLYIWHILEARLVTSVSLHTETSFTIKSCFWATVENGLIYILTTCEGVEDNEVCRLLTANLATGFCQNAMLYRQLPFQASQGQLKIVKAVYVEPFLVVAHQEGVLMWSVFKEFCCAAFSAASQITTVTLCKDTLKWSCLAVGNFSCLKCFKLNW